MLNIPIVVVAYNRKEPLMRLLASLKKALYPDSVKLIISIDGGVENRAVVDVANQFEWDYGDKEVIVSEHNLGLRNHILKCGRLTKQYDGIVLLEDDLYVSPYFYKYLITAHDVYHDDQEIAGVALYSHQYNETACLPFRQIEDGYDVFFMQVACSWGQSWLKHQWALFEAWYELHHNTDLSEDVDIPPDVRLWPATSWKKYYLKYIIENRMFFVYPRVSLATNFGDPGVHHKGSNIFQVPLLYAEMKYRFPESSQSISKYDAYCEIFHETLIKYNKELSGYDFEVDLYGMKNKYEVAKKHILTSQAIDQPIKSFGRNLKPHELNVCENVHGEKISLGLKSRMSDYGDFIRYRNNLNQDYVNTHDYYYSITRLHYKPAAVHEHVPVKNSIFSRIYKMLNDMVDFLP